MPRIILSLLFFAQACCGAVIEQGVVKLIGEGKYVEAKNLLIEISSLDKSEFSTYGSKDYLAVCEYNLLAPEKAKALWSDLLSDPMVPIEVKGRAWKNLLIMSVDTCDVETVKRLAKMRDGDRLAWMCLQMIRVFTGDELELSMKELAQPKSPIEIALLGECDYLYRLRAFSTMGASIQGARLILPKTEFALRLDEQALMAFYLGELDLSEKLQRAVIVQESGAANKPRHDKPLLRLARIFSSRGDINLADILVKEADNFIVSVYGDKSPLRVWPIDEKARLLVKSGNVLAAKTLIESAQRKFPEFRVRLAAALNDVPAIVP